MLPNEDIQDTEKAFAKTTILTSGAHIKHEDVQSDYSAKTPIFQIWIPTKSCVIVMTVQTG